MGPTVPIADGPTCNRDDGHVRRSPRLSATIGACVRFASLSSPCSRGRSPSRAPTRRRRRQRRRWRRRRSRGRRRGRCFAHRRRIRRAPSAATRPAASTAPWRCRRSATAFAWPSRSATASSAIRCSSALIRDLGKRARRAAPAAAVGRRPRPAARRPGADGARQPSDRARRRPVVPAAASPAQAQSMVDRARMQPSPKFTDGGRARCSTLAATDARVERIFVNPVLKRALCERTATSDDRALAAASCGRGGGTTITSTCGSPVPPTAPSARRRRRCRRATAAASSPGGSTRRRRPIAKRATRPTPPRWAPRRRCRDGCRVLLDEK